jgi:polyhydroxybutyrate depolymerase
MTKHSRGRIGVAGGPIRRAVLLLPALAIVCSVVVGVGPAAAGPSGDAPPTVVLAGAAKQGCGVAVPSGSTTSSLRIGGHTRTVIVHIPAGYTGKTKVPLVLNMHGSGSNAAQQELFSGMDVESDAAGFIVAYPQGLIPSGQGFDWNVPGVPLIGGAAPPKNAANDMQFLSLLVAVLQERYCVNRSRVYATGFSGGARITSQLACEYSNIFAAVAPVSGLRRPTPCQTIRSVPIVAFHGTADPVDPYNGHGQAYWTYSVPQAERYWASQDECSTHAATSTPDPGVTLTTYSHCGGGAVVELYSITGEGHEWPDGPKLTKKVTRVLGPQSTAVNADAVMWAFFMAHKLP